MVVCCMISCNSSNVNFLQPGINFYKFPTEENRRRAWIDAVGRNDWMPSKFSVICSKHFKESDFLLKEDAVPFSTQKRLNNIPVKVVYKKAGSQEYFISEEPENEEKILLSESKLLRISDAVFPDTQRYKELEKTSETRSLNNPSHEVYQENSPSTVLQSNSPGISIIQESSSSVPDPSRTVIYQYNQSCFNYICTYPLLTYASNNPTTAQTLSVNNASIIPVIFNSVQDSITTQKSSSVDSGSTTIHNSSKSVTFSGAAEQISQPINILHKSITQSTENVKSVPKEITIRGRRIIDFMHFFNRLKSLNQHSKLGCNLNHVIITDERKVGLRSSYYLNCTVCNYQCIIWSENPAHQENINSDTIYGMMITNCRLQQMNKLLSKMKLPVLNYAVFFKEHRKIALSRDNNVTQKKKCKRMAELTAFLKRNKKNNQFDLIRKYRSLISNQVQEGVNVAQKSKQIAKHLSHSHALKKSKKKNNQLDLIRKYRSLISKQVQKGVNVAQKSKPIAKHLSHSHALKKSKKCNDFHLNRSVTANRCENKGQGHDTQRESEFGKLLPQKTELKIPENISVIDKEKIINATRIEENNNSDDKDNELNGSQVNKTKVLHSDCLLEYNDSSKMFSQQLKSGAYENKMDVDYEQVKLDKTLVKPENQDGSYLHDEEETLNTTKIKKKITLDVYNDKLIESQVNKMDTLNSDSLLEYDDPSRTLFRQQKTAAYEDKIDVNKEQLKLDETPVKEGNQHDSDLPENKFTDIKIIQKDNLAVGQEKIFNTMNIKKGINQDVCSDELIGSQICEIETLNNDCLLEYDDTTRMLSQQQTVRACDGKKDVEKEQIKLCKTSEKQENKDHIDLQESEFSDMGTIYKEVVDQEKILDTQIKKKINSDVYNNKLTGFQVSEMAILNSNNFLEYNDHPAILIQQQKNTTYEDKMDMDSEQVKLDKTLVKQENQDGSESEFGDIVIIQEDILTIEEENTINTRIKKEINSDVHNNEVTGSQVSEIETLNSNNLLENDDTSKMLIQQQKVTANKDKCDVYQEQINFYKTLVKQENQDDSELCEFGLSNYETINKDILITDQEKTLNIRIKGELDSDAHNQDLTGSQVSEIDNLSSECILDYDSSSRILVQQQEDAAYEDKWFVDKEQISFCETLVQQKNKDGDELHGSEFRDKETLIEDIFVVDQEETLNIRIKKEPNSDAYDDELTASQDKEIENLNGKSCVEYDSSSKMLVQQQKNLAHEDECDVDKEQINFYKTLVKQKNQDSNELYESEFSDNETIHKDILVVDPKEILNTRIKKEINSNVYNDELTASQACGRETLNSHSLLEYDDSSRMSLQQENVTAYEDGLGADKEQIKLHKTQVKQENEDDSDLFEFGDNETIQNDIITVDEEETLNTTKIKEEINLDVYNDESSGSQVNGIELLNNDSLLECNDSSRILSEQQEVIIIYEDKMDVDEEQIKLYKIQVKQENQDHSDLYESEFNDNETTHKDNLLVDQEKTLNATRIKKEINPYVFDELSIPQINEIEILNSDSCLEYNDPSGILSHQQEVIISEDKMNVDAEEIKLYKILVKQKNQSNDLHEFKFIDIETIRKNSLVIDHEKILNTTGIQKEINSDVRNVEVAKSQIGKMKTLNSNLEYGDSSRMLSQQQNITRYEDKLDVDKEHLKLSKTLVKLENQDDSDLDEANCNVIETIQKNIITDDKEKTLNTTKIKEEINLDVYNHESIRSEVDEMDMLNSESYREYDDPSRILAQRQKITAYEDNMNIDKEPVKLHETLVMQENQDDSDLDEPKFIETIQKDIITDDEEETLHTTRIKEEINLDVNNDESNESQVDTLNSDSFLEYDDPSRILAEQQKISAYEDKVDINKKHAVLYKTVKNKVNQDNSGLCKPDFSAIKKIKKDIITLDEGKMLNSTKNKEEINKDVYNDKYAGSDISETKILNNNILLEGSSSIRTLHLQKKLRMCNHKILVKIPLHKIKLRKTQQNHGDSDQNRPEFNNMRTMHKNTFVVDQEKTLNTKRIINEINSHVCDGELNGSEMSEMKKLTTDSRLEYDDPSRILSQSRKGKVYKGKMIVNKDHAKVGNTVVKAGNQNENDLHKSKFSEKDIAVAQKKTLNIKKAKKKNNSDVCDVEINKSKVSQIERLNKHSPVEVDIFSRMLSEQKKLRMYVDKIVVNRKQVKLNKTLIKKKKKNQGVKKLRTSVFKDLETTDKNISAVQKVQLATTCINKENNSDMYNDELFGSEISEIGRLNSDNLPKYGGPSKMSCKYKKISMYEDKIVVGNENIKLHKTKRENKNDCDLYEPGSNDLMIDEEDHVKFNNELETNVPLKETETYEEDSVKFNNQVETEVTLKETETYEEDSVKCNNELKTKVSLKETETYEEDSVKFNNQVEAEVSLKDTGIYEKDNVKFRNQPEAEVPLKKTKTCENRTVISQTNIELGEQKSKRKLYLLVEKEDDNKFKSSNKKYQCQSKRKKIVFLKKTEKVGIDQQESLSHQKKKQNLHHHQMYKGWS